MTEDETIRVLRFIDKADLELGRVLHKLTNEDVLVLLNTMDKK